MEKKIAFLEKVIALSKAGNHDAAVKLAAGKERILTSKAINQVFINIKKVERGELDQATPIYKLYEYDANRYFILVGLINIVVLLIIYIGMRRYCTNDK